MAKDSLTDEFRAHQLLYNRSQGCRSDILVASCEKPPVNQGPQSKVCCCWDISAQGYFLSRDRSHVLTHAWERLSDQKVDAMNLSQTKLICWGAYR